MARNATWWGAAPESQRHLGRKVTRRALQYFITDLSKTSDK